MDKTYFDANSLLLDSYKLAKKIYNSRYRPELIIGLWRGGSLIAMCIDEYFRYQNSRIPTYPLKVEAYKGIDKRKKEITLGGLGSLIEYILGNKINNVLIVDDVKDTGGSLEKTVTSLSQFIKKIKTATIYYKPSKDKTHTSPNFYLYRTDKWIVFPHEIKGLKKHELKKKSEELHNILTT